ncbi:MAG TPA: kelch repeat-containing protein [Byssovorax sp.]|jgi:hypothetical protein
MRLSSMLVLSFAAAVGCGSRSPLDAGGSEPFGGGPTPALHEVVLTGIAGAHNAFETWTFDDAVGWTHLDVDPPFVLGEAEPPPAMVAAGGASVVLWMSFPARGTVTSAFDGTTWRAVGGSGPSPRTSPAFASLGDHAVLFGGLDDSRGRFLADTWVFDGASWTLVDVSRSPPARERAAFAELDGKLVLFGGDAGEVFDDTWTFDGAAWHEVRVGSPRPSSRTGAVLAPLDGELVLFGGQLPPNGQLGDTWSFDGRHFRELQQGGGPPAQSSALFAPLGDQVVLFGQRRPFGGVPWDDTWLFHEGGWLDAGSGGPLFSGWQPAMAAIDRD